MRRRTGFPTTVTPVLHGHENGDKCDKGDEGHKDGKGHSPKR